VGLVQREIEAAGFSTITLSNIPAMTAAVSAPRVAGIEYPFSLTVGRPGDREGQLAVLRATLQALQEMDTPGQVVHLPFEWTASEEELPPHPSESPPIAKYLLRHPWHVRRLFSRDVPD